MGRRKRVHSEVVCVDREVNQGLAAQFIGWHSVTKVLDGLRGCVANEFSQRFSSLALGCGQCRQVGIDGQSARRLCCQTYGDCCESGAFRATF